MVEDLTGPEDKDLHVVEKEEDIIVMMNLNTVTGIVWVKVYNTEIFTGMYKQKLVVSAFFQARFPDLSFTHPQKKIPKYVQLLPTLW